MLPPQPLRSPLAEALVGLRSHIGRAWQQDPGDRSLARRGPQFHPPAMGADQGLDDRQTEAGAGASRVGARAVGSIEAFEDPVGLFLGQAGSLVGDFEVGVAVGDADADRGAGGGVGDGVADQVEDDLAQGGGPRRRLGCRRRGQSA